MTVLDPYMPDTEGLLSRSMSHLVSARVVMPDGETIALDVESGRIGWDETRSPRVEADLTCRVPTDAAALARIDPRVGTRLQIDVGYARPGGLRDTHTIADLALRTRPVRRPDDLMSVTGQSDESLLIDAAVCVSGTLNQTNTLNAIATVIHQVLPSATVQWSLASAGSAINQSQVDTDRWDTIQDLADRISAQVFDDGLRTWHVNDQPVLGTPALTLTVGESGTVVTSESTLDRDSWANWVVLRYVWTDASNVRQRVVGSRRITAGPYAAVTGNIKIFLDERETPTTQAEADTAAAALVQRTVTRGRSIRLSAISAYWLRPGHTVTVQLPTGQAQDLLVSSVEFDLQTGLMDVTTRLPDNTGTIGA